MTPVDHQAWGDTGHFGPAHRKALTTVLLAATLAAALSPSGCAPMPDPALTSTKAAGEGGAGRAPGVGRIRLVQLHVRSLGGLIPGPSLDYLAKALKEYTDLEVAQPVTGMALDDADLLSVPWVRLPDVIGTRVLARDLTSGELTNLGHYLAGGGFLLARRPADEHLRTGLYDILRTALKEQQLYEGSDWRFVRLDGSHPVYHSVFDIGSEDDEVGLVVRGRLAALLARRPILTDRAWIRRGDAVIDGTRLLQFVVNTVVFALGQQDTAAEAAP